MKTLESTFVTAVTNLLILVVCFSLAMPAQAASLAEVEQALIKLQTALSEYQTAKTGEVLGATVINVSNDKELFDALATVTGGETILLQPGVYGRVFVRSGQYTQYKVGTLKKSGYSPTPTSKVKITSANINNRAVIQGVEIIGSNNWHFEGLSFFPITKDTAAQLGGDNITFINNNISFGNTKSWDATQWNAVGNGIAAGGRNNEVAYNYIKNVSVGISVSGENNRVHHNYIINFTTDGMRGFGKNALIEHNYITNPIRSSATNHYDGFQSWSRGADGRVGAGLVEGMVLRSNTIMYQTKSAIDGLSPLVGVMQGMNMFDGSAKGAIIENNLIVVNHYHGMSWAGAIDTTIQNNVAVDPTYTTRPGPSWIRISNHKNGTPPVNSRILNNYSNHAMVSSTSTRVSIANHTKLEESDYARYFVDPKNGNFTPKSGAFPFAVGANLNMNQLAPEPVFISGSTTPTTPVTPTKPPTPVATTTPATSSIVWLPLATEGNTFQVSGTQIVRYGKGTTWVQKTVTGSGTCSNAFFGRDPLVGIVKDCQLRVTAAPGTGVTPTTPTTSTTNTKPVAAFTISDKAPRVGERVTFSASPSQRATSFVWDDAVGSVGQYPLGTGETITFTFKNPGTKKIRLTTSNQYGTDVKIIPIEVRATTTTPTTPPTPATTTAKTVYTTDVLNVRSTANGTKIGTQPKGARGTHLNAPGTTIANVTWVKVDFATGVDGFVAQNFLASSTTSTSVISSTQAQIDAILKQIVALQILLDKLRAVR